MSVVTISIKAENYIPGNPFQGTQSSKLTEFVMASIDSEHIKLIKWPFYECLSTMLLQFTRTIFESSLSPNLVQSKEAFNLFIYQAKSVPHFKSSPFCPGVTQGLVSDVAAT